MKLVKSLCAVALLCGVLLTFLSSVHAEVKTVRKIAIEIREVFDEPDIGLFYRTVNQLKISTRLEVIRRELLIKEGDTFDQFLLDESVRNLRTLPFIRKVKIVPVVDGEAVDLIVSVQDTWTLVPQLSFAMGGGKDKQSLGLAEGNLLGYGKQLEFFYGENDGREQIFGTWNDRRVFGSEQELDLSHLSRSDGYSTAGAFGKPFRSLVDPDAWEFSYRAADLVNKLFEGGEERFIFRQEHFGARLNYSFQYGEPSEVAQRVRAGGIFSKDSFKMPDASDFEDADVDPTNVSQDPSLLAEDRTFAGPAISYERIEPDFISLNYIDRFERIEDFNLGNSFFMQGWYASRVFDSSADTFILSISDSDGLRLSPTSFIRGELGGSARLHSGSLDNGILRGDARYFNVLGTQRLLGVYLGKHTLVSALSVEFGADLDKDREYVIGAETGLRGYKEDTFTGTSRLVLNFEDRFHLVEDVLRLVNIGGAVFVDVGGTSNKGIGDIVSRELYGDIGAGLRIGLPRSSSGRVIRIDLAFPFREGPDGSEKWEPRLLISLGQLFSAQMASESRGAERANSSTGLTPY